MSNVEQRVIKIVAEQLGLATSEVKPTSHLQDDLGADSLDSVELVMAIEDEFALEIDDDTAEKLSTVQSIIDHLAARGTV
jgi:acyl carrier protein